MSNSKNFSLKTFFHTYRGLPNIYTAGELALVSSPLFREHGLRLYRKRTSLILNWFLCVSYLIVKDHTPVLELRTDCDPDHIFFRGSRPGQLPICPIYDRDMKDGRVDKVLAQLEPLLQEPCTPSWPDCTYIPVSPTVHNTMAGLHMIREQNGGIWLPTDYGNSLGLIDGYMIQDDGQPCHTLFIPSERTEELDRARAWPRACREEEPQAVMPLEQRLKKARQGLPSSNAAAIELVRAFGAIPFADYTASYLDGAEELRAQFGEIATFQEAADKIYQFCMERHHPGDCGEYIACLIYPLVLIFDGTAPVNQATKPAQELLRLPFPSLLMGAAMASGQPCLLRNTQLLLDDVLDGNADNLQTTCRDLIHKICDCGKDAGTALLLRLFVEPFALLNQSLNVPRR